MKGRDTTSSIREWDDDALESVNSSNDIVL
jgi:hypothetical protein